MTLPKLEIPPPRIALTPAEAAAALGVGISFFNEYVRPDLPAIRRGRVVLFSVQSLEAWAAENGEHVLRGSS